MKRPVILAVSVFALSIAGAVFFFKGRKYDYTITQSRIDAALQERFPVTKTYYRVFQVTYSNPRVRLLPDTNRIEVALDAGLEINLLVKSVKMGSRAIATTGITYRDDTHQFFLSDPEIAKLTFQGIPQSGVDAAGDLARKTAEKLDALGITQEQITKVTDSAKALALDRLRQYPVYTLKGRDAKSAAAKLILRKVEVRGSEIHVTLGL